MPPSVFATGQPPSAPEALARCRDLARPALVLAIDELDPSLRPLAAYACGVGSDSPGGERTRPTSERAYGKGIRQAFAILAAEASGGNAESAVPAAVAVELLHTFSLVHDDIMDHDERRRHRPTVWKAFGSGPATLAGDALLVLAMDVATRSAGDRSRGAVRLLCGALTGLMRGQAQDLQFEKRPWRGPRAVTLDEYGAMARDKTGALFAASAALGALLAGGGPRVVEAFSRAGDQFGLAFQAADDLLGIWGDPEWTGKPVGGDLRRRKKTLPVVAALDEGGGAAGQLVELLESREELTDEELRTATGLIEALGGREATHAASRQALAEAWDALADIPLVPRAWLELTELADYLVGRPR